MKRWPKMIWLVAGSAAAAVALALLINPEPTHAASLLDGIFGKDPNDINRNDIVRVLMQLIQFALMFASAVAAIFIVVNGYQYILSAGNPEKIEKAKMGLTWSVGGLILAISSYAIVYLTAKTLGVKNNSNLGEALDQHKPGSLPGTVPGILDSIANILFIFAGAVAVIFIILGGYRYVTSQGNRELAEKAQKTLLYAVVGLIIVFAAFLIFNLIATRLEVTNQFS